MADLVKNVIERGDGKGGWWWEVVGVDRGQRVRLSRGGTGWLAVRQGLKYRRLTFICIKTAYRRGESFNKIRLKMKKQMP